MGCVDSRLGCPEIISHLTGTEGLIPGWTTNGRPDWFDPGRWPVPLWSERPGNLSELTNHVEDPDPNDDETLRVEKVDYQIPQNTSTHRTDEYSVTEGANPALVVRRGEPFNIAITFNRPYDKKSDDLRLVFETGENPKRKNGTHVEFILSDKDRPGAWGAMLQTQEERSVHLKVFTPPECMVAQWSFSVDVVKRKETGVTLFRYKHKQPIYILFNAWCRDDAVYLDSQDKREEYVLNDSGKIFAGAYNKISAKPWAFGQFEDKVLQCSMFLLDKCRLRPEERGDPIMVTRRLSAVVNAPDDVGVLMGNWSGNYEGGTRPLSWTGSVPILVKFFTEKRPVKFGQCWVFSGVLTTVCRSLGLPTRSVTNFSSAHDTDGSTTIDNFIDTEGSPLKHLNHDSVWNFHVWNEAWMARPDLPPGYGGWQAFDATPQERSDGVYCCGPCPVRALKEGEVKLGYDGPFIFAEVNADRVRWQLNEDGSKRIVNVEKSAVGKNISTRSLSGGREDVTLEYKYHEKSAAERVAVRKAQQLMLSPVIEYLEDTHIKDVEFKLDFDSEGTFVGDDFVLKLPCHNGSSEPRTLAGFISINTMYYTGVEAEEVATNRFREITLKPGQREVVEVKVSEGEYWEKLKEMCMLSLTAMVKVKETGQIFAQTDNARLRKPHLQIQGPGSVKVGEEMEVEVTFTNPLERKLNDCTLDVEAPGFTKISRQSYGNLDGKAAFSTTLKLTPTRQGRHQREIVFIFTSKELEDINGTHQVQVTG